MFSATKKQKENKKTLAVKDQKKKRHIENEQHAKWMSITFPIHINDE